MCFVWISELTANFALYNINVLVLGAFAKLRKATVSIIMSFCPSVRMGQLGCHWTDFHEICYLSTFKTFVSLEPDMSN